jgi:hypothetical protein
MEDLTQEFEDAIESTNASFLHEIESRNCESDNFSGIEYQFYGAFVPVRPIINVVAETEGAGIEHLSHTNDGRTCLTVFVANIPEQSHPAFVEQS